MNTKKPIRLSHHAEEQAKYRGTNEEEIHRAILESEWQQAELGRLQSQINLAFNKKWNDKTYVGKQVKPVFIEERDEIIVVTVYVYYF